MVENRQSEALTIICLFPILAALFVATRTCSRYIGRNFGWDDGLIFVSLFLLLGETIASYKYVLLSHTGYHKHDIPKQSVAQQVLTLKWSFAVQMFYHPMMGAIRASIIMFLFRIKDRRPRIRWALHTVFWINIGYLVSTIVVNVVQCSPVRYTYLRPEMDQPDANGKVIPHGKCINSLAFILASCSLSIFMDLIIIPIPTVMVWNLQMERKIKIAIVVIMSMGWLATVVSVARFIIYYYRFEPTRDRTWDIGIVVSIVEPSVGIIAACAPAMRSIASHLFPEYFSDDTSSYPTQTHSNKSPRRQSLSYHFGMNEENNPAQADALEREEAMYGLRPIGDMDSCESIMEVDTNGPQRQKSTKTTRSEAVEASPTHVLSHRE